MKLSTKILIFVILSINFSIINYFFFSPNLIFTIRIDGINESQNNIYKEQYVFFKENDKIYSIFFDGDTYIKNLFKYNSFIRIKKYHKQNKFEIIASNNLLIKNLLNDLNAYRQSKASDENIYDFKIIKKDYINSNLFSYFLIIFITLIFLIIINNLKYDKK